MSNKKDRSAEGSMVAPHPPAGGGIRPVEDLAAEYCTPAAKLAALRRATGWAPGKQVSAAEYEMALEALKSRPMGGGRI